MALLGLYVGVIPVALGMLWLPWMRRIPPAWLRVGHGAHRRAARRSWRSTRRSRASSSPARARRPSAAPRSCSSARAVAYLALTGVGAWLDARAASERAARGAARRPTLALLVAIGIGLHNLGEGLAIGSAYATGALALGAFLVVGFALHNTTEGLAIVAPLARARAVARRGSRVLGLIAGAPAIARRLDRRRRPSTPRSRRSSSASARARSSR